MEKQIGLVLIDTLSYRQKNLIILCNRIKVSVTLPFVIVYLFIFAVMYIVILVLVIIED